MTPQELQHALSAVEPSAVLVPQRVLENIIQQVSQTNGMVWSIPHQMSWIVDRQILFRHIEQEDLALAPDQILPASVILIAWPQEDDRRRHDGLGLLLETWRRLFHATMHRVLEKAWEDGTMTPARLRQRIDFLTPTAFEEVGKVLSQDRLLLPHSDERVIYTEFVAVFLEQWFFDKKLLSSYFPGLQNSEEVYRQLEQDFDAKTRWRETRLPGAPEPGYLEQLVPSEADEYFYHLEEASNAALAKGNLVLAAIQKQRAARVAPSDKGEATRREGIALLERLLTQMQAALDLPMDELEGWRRLMPTLLDKADQGSHPAEAALLYDLQQICEDHQNEIYSVEVVEWLTSFGRRPLKRPLPSQRLVRSAHTLHAAVQKLTLARLSVEDRRELHDLLNRALHRREETVRNHFRPKLTAVFLDVGLKPNNVLDTVAFNKMIEETLDQILDNGYITFSDLRDTISRNQLRLGDLTDPQDFIRGDALQLLDRRLAAPLDGVYHSSEFYLRWLERVTSINFGTKLGRLLTQWITIPIGAAWLCLEGFLLLVFGHAKARELPVAEEEALTVEGSSLGLTAYFSIWAVLTLVIMAILHSAPLRQRCRNVGKQAMRGVYAAFVRFPVWALSHAWVKQLFQSWSFHLAYWYVLKPLVLCAFVWLLWPQFFGGWFEKGVSFALVTFFVNSRPGESFWNLLTKSLQDFSRLIRAGLIPSVFRFIIVVYKKIMSLTESLFFSVDEMLRIRKVESRSATVARYVLSVLWFPISYIARFNLVVFIEPCLHPLKFPICSLATKFLLPILPTIRLSLYDGFNTVFGDVMASALSWWVTFWLPDVFGFLFWEIKENWALYRANRPQTLEPVAIGGHGETMRQLFVPGFHAGTLPRLFRKIRHAELQASGSGKRSAVRSYDATLTELREKVRQFITREFCELLRMSPHWHGVALRVGDVHLSTNQIRIDLHHPAHGNFLETRITKDVTLERLDRQPSEKTALRVTFENRAGWIVADISDRGWVHRLAVEQTVSFENALAVLYKLSSVDLVKEQLEKLYNLTPSDSLTFSADALTIFGAQAEQRRVIPLVPPAEEETQEGDAPLSLWTPEKLLYADVEITRTECERSFPTTALSTAPARLVPEFSFLPPLIPAAVPATEKGLTNAS